MKQICMVVAALATAACGGGNTSTCQDAFNDLVACEVKLGVSAANAQAALTSDLQKCNSSTACSALAPCFSTAANNSCASETTLHDAILACQANSTCP